MSRVIIQCRSLIMCSDLYAIFLFTLHEESYSAICDYEATLVTSIYSMS